MSTQLEMAKVFSVSEPSNNAERIVFDELRKDLSYDYYLLYNGSFQNYVNGNLGDLTSKEQAKNFFSTWIKKTYVYCEDEKAEDLLLTAI